VDFTENEQQKSHLEGFVNTLSYKPLVVNNYRVADEIVERNQKGLIVSLAEKRDR